MIGELDKAIQYMSKRRIGALITIQQNTGLDDYIETGIN
jgi:diadenylate cyclase